MHELLVNPLFKPAQEKVWLGELTVPAMTIAVDLGRKATTQTNKQTKICRLGTSIYCKMVHIHVPNTYVVSPIWLKMYRKKNGKNNTIEPTVL